MDKLDPTNVLHCQRWFGSSPFTLGISPPRQCGKLPVFIAVEKESGDDGEQGAMSLCADCAKDFELRGQTEKAWLFPIVRAPLTLKR